MDYYGEEKKEKEKHYDNIKKLVEKFNEKMEKLSKFDKEEFLTNLNINDQIFDNYKFDIYNNLFKKITEIEKKLGSETKEINTNISYVTDNSKLMNYNTLDNDNIFSKIFNKYVKDINNKNKLSDEADDNFYNSVKSNDINPDEVLKISNSDKIIFIILIFVIRQISLLTVNYLIDNNLLLSFKYIMLFYNIIYISLFIIILLIVNFDNYKLRILFNYLNLHINFYGISTHISMLILFSFIIYYYIVFIDSSINRKDTDNSDLNDMEKIDYKYKLSVVSLIIYIFTSIIDYML